MSQDFSRSSNSGTPYHSAPTSPQVSDVEIKSLRRSSLVTATLKSTLFETETKRSERKKTQIQTTEEADSQPQTGAPALPFTPDQANRPRKRLKENQTPSPEVETDQLAELAAENALLQQQLVKAKEDSAATLHQLRRELEEERRRRATAEKEAVEARKRTQKLEAEVQKMKEDISKLQATTLGRDEASLQRLILDTIRLLLAGLSSEPTPSAHPPPASSQTAKTKPEKKAPAPVLPTASRAKPVATEVLLPQRMKQKPVPPSRSTYTSIAGGQKQPATASKQSQPPAANKRSRPAATKEGIPASKPATEE